MKIFVYVLILFNLAYWPIRYGAGAALRRHLGPGFWFAANFTFLAGFVSPSAPLFLVASALTFWLGVGTPLQLACRYALLLPLMPGVTSFISVGGHSVGGYSPADMLNLTGAAMTLAVRRRAGEQPVRGLSLEDAAVALLFVVMGFAPFRFTEPELLWRALLATAVALVPAYLVVRGNLLTREQLLVVAGCLGVSAAILGVMALAEQRLGWALFDTVTRRFSNGDAYLARSASIRGGLLRASVTADGPIELGILMVSGLAGLYAARRLFARRNIWLGTVGVVLLGTLATQSRLAVIGAVLGLLLALVARRRRVAAAVVAGGAAAGFLFMIALSHSSGRVAAFMGQTKVLGTYRDYRTLLLDRGLEEGAKHPFLGTSLKDVIDRLADIRQGEQIVDLVNTYLVMFLVSGVVGLGAVLLVLGGVLLPLVRGGGDAPRSPGETARAFALAMLATLLMQLAGMSFIGRVPAMLVVGLGFARLVRTSSWRRREGVPPVPPREAGARPAPAALPA